MILRDDCDIIGHQRDVCHNWTSSVELIDQVLDTRVFSLTRTLSRRYHVFSITPYFTYSYRGCDVPINICPRCIVQGACILEATIRDEPCDHAACWPDEDVTLFGFIGGLEH